MKTRGYQSGDRVWWRNSWGQEFYATVLRAIGNLGLLIVKVDGDEFRHEQSVDLDTAVMSRSWHK